MRRRLVHLLVDEPGPPLKADPLLGIAEGDDGGRWAARFACGAAAYQDIPATQHVSDVTCYRCQLAAKAFADGYAAGAALRNALPASVRRAPGVTELERRMRGAGR